MHDYIIQRVEQLLKKMECDIDNHYLLGALTELQIMAITFHEWEASDFIESILNNNVRVMFFK